MSTPSKHQKFLADMAKRASQRSGKPTAGTFGYGIGTADRYVRHVIDTVDSLPNGVRINDETLKRAARTVTFANPESQIEHFVFGAREVAEDAKVLQQTEPADFLPKGVKVPPNTLMVLQHVITTPREDRDTDILLTEGATLDPKSPLLWQHMHDFPIGKVLAELQHDKKVLRVATALLDINELTADAAKLIEADVLRISHGFRVLDYEERDPDDHSFYGFLIKEFEIMEVSLVSVPSNVDAEIELFAAGKLASPTFKSHAKTLFDARTKQAPGMELTPTTEPAGQAPATPIEGDASPSPGGLVGDDCKAAPPAVETGPEEKTGRVLSATMANRIREAVNDLDELTSTDDLSRTQNALIGSCRGRLQLCLDEADEASTEGEQKALENAGDNEPELEPEPEPNKSADVEPEATAPADVEPAPEPQAEPGLTFDRALEFLLARATDEQLNVCADSFQAVQQVHDADKRAAEFRKAIGSF